MCSWEVWSDLEKGGERSSSWSGPLRMKLLVVALFLRDRTLSEIKCALCVEGIIFLFSSFFFFPLLAPRKDNGHKPQAQPLQIVVVIRSVCLAGRVDLSVVKYCLFFHFIIT